jgi:hypothetical protein
MAALAFIAFMAAPFAGSAAAFAFIAFIAALAFIAFMAAPFAGSAAALAFIAFMAALAFIAFMTAPFAGSAAAFAFIAFMTALAFIAFMAAMLSAGLKRAGWNRHDFEQNGSSNTGHGQLQTSADQPFSNIFPITFIARLIVGIHRILIATQRPDLNRWSESSF